jgi:Flp pilus assembly protein TadG
MPTSSFRNNRGAAVIEFCLILPVLVVMVFAIVDIGRLIQARLIITNVTREGGSLASRELMPGAALIAMLQSSASPLNLGSSGKICISNIEAGTITRNAPVISGGNLSPLCRGSLGVSSGINSGGTLGLTQEVYNHLVFRPENQASDINGVTVVETFYRYTPITPLPNFITNTIFNVAGGTIIGSRAVFCATTGEQP